jgi:hypothetical protein
VFWWCFTFFGGLVVGVWGFVWFGGFVYMLNTSLLQLCYSFGGWCISPGGCETVNVSYRGTRTSN